MKCVQPACKIENKIYTEGWSNKITINNNKILFSCFCSFSLFNMNPKIFMRFSVDHLVNETQ